ncbi:MAG: protein tyrosine phosphatase [Bacteroidetes bacterium GWA2_30_7]|nr:MAG: protein tyrosine phosphatase [Bacteroidetes bacterium GWA2_30_7]
MKILILCNTNSCRCQMAQGFLQSFDENITVCSAGTNASGKLNEKAIVVMQEVGIDISNQKSNSVEKYITDSWDFVITVCCDAKKNCPVFTGNVKNNLHLAFDDPSCAVGTEEFIMSEFRRVRDEIKGQFYEFYKHAISGKRF